MVVLLKWWFSLDHGAGNRYHILFVRHLQGGGLEDHSHFHGAGGLDGVQGNFFSIKGGDGFKNFLGACHRNGFGRNLCMGQNQLFG